MWHHGEELPVEALGLKAMQEAGRLERDSVVVACGSAEQFDGAGCNLAVEGGTPSRRGPVLRQPSSLSSSVQKMRM